MSEETTAPAEAPADETAALMAADDILWGNADAEAPEAEVADGEEAPAEAAPDEEAPADEEAPQEAADGDDDAEAEPEQAADEEARALVAKDWADYRRKMKAAERKEAEISQRLQAFESERAQFGKDKEALATLLQQFRDDPEAALGEVARRAGTTPDAMYERITARRLGEESSDPEAIRQIRELRAELERRDAEAAKAREEQQRNQTQAQREKVIAGDVAKVAGIADSPQLAERWPHLAAMPAEHRRAKAEEAIRYCVANGLAQSISLDQIAGALDKEAADLYRSMVARMGNGQGSPPIGAEGEGPPDAGIASRSKPTAHRKRRTVSNADATHSGGPRRDLTDAERMAEADDLLRAWTGQTYAQ